MKRSEMISILQNLIHQEIDGSGTMSFSDTDYILEKLEDFGMLPPFSYEEFQKNWQKDREDSIGGNVWEPE